MLRNILGTVIPLFLCCANTRINTVILTSVVTPPPTIDVVQQIFLLALYISMFFVKLLPSTVCATFIFLLLVPHFFLVALMLGHRNALFAVKFIAFCTVELPYPTVE